jgi:hypothetical protein
MKRVVAALALSCLLFVSALAGDVPSVPAPQPPPDQIQGQTVIGPSTVSSTSSCDEALAKSIVEAIQAILSLLAV